MTARREGPRRGRSTAATGLSGWIALVTAVAVMSVLGACSTGSPGSGASGSASAGAASSGAAGSGAPSSGTSAPARTGYLPSAEQLAAARADVAKLPTERLAAQLVVVRQPGSSAQTAQALREHGYGGVAVFRENLPTDGSAASAATQANAAYSQAVEASGRDWPAFISIDQEGGPVTRIDAPLTRFPALMALGAAGSPELATRVGAASGAELRGLGYTVVMAPDADVTSGPKDPTIGVRSAGSDPAAVGRIATALATGYLRSGIMPTLKHFPGHGSVATDSHAGLPRQDASLDTLQRRDLVPFRDGIAAGLPAVMTAHIVLSALDATNPSTLSPAVLGGLLRRDLGFTGVVVTDALEMAAVTQQYGAGAAAVRAVQAGADVLLMPADPALAVRSLTQAVDQGRLTRARLEESAARMVAALRADVAAPPKDSAPGSHQQLAAEVAAASIVQLSGRCGARLVGSSVSVTGGDGADRAAFEAAARRAGLGVGSGTRVALLGGQAYRAGDGGASAAAAGSADVAVALDVPYALATATAPAGKLATFARTPATFDALVHILLGQRRAVGRLPVAVGAQSVGSGCGAS